PGPAHRSGPRSRHVRRSHPLAGAAAILTLVLAGCSDDGTTISEQARDGTQKGYVSGDGTVEQLAPEERSVTIELEGEVIAGTDPETGKVQLEPWTSTEAQGEVLVINVWGSWCGPCVEEVPALKAVHEHFAQADAPVQFIGVNDRDSA